jgi:CDP-glycerol glycerophosphotransferase
LATSLSARGARAGRLAGALAFQRLGRARRDRVLFNSFNGRFSDSPRAIYEELRRRDGSLHATWIAAAPDGEFPAGTTQVAPYSFPYLREVGRAGTVVSNLQMPRNLIKRPHVTYLQTWHGTPLKRIGYDNERWQRNPAGLATMARDFAKWDFLISPNRFSTDIFRRAFRYQGEVLETGYPRNDALSAPDRDAVRARVRRALGISDDQRVVLYAPTWRDDQVTDTGSLRFSLQLDVDALAERLGGDHVFLLRLHYLLAASLGDASPHARNVSDHADIRELYLAADVLVTDYSSAMFDFAITGRPIVFFTYDLDTYRDDVRGFYFDLEAEAPGPLCRTSEAVGDALAGLDAVTAAHAGRYAAFRERFCPFDDGHASARVVDRLFGATGG